MGFDVLEPMPDRHVNQLLQLAENTHKLKALYKPWKDSVITRDVGGVVAAMFDLQYHEVMGRGNYWYWAWVCECPVGTLPTLFVQDGARIRQLVSNWSVSAATDSWVCLTAVEPSAEIERLNELLLPKIVEHLRPLGGGASALLNQGVASITFEHIELADLHRHTQALVGIRGAVIEAAKEVAGLGS